MGPRFLFAVVTLGLLACTAAAQHICRGRPVIAAPIVSAYHAPAVVAHHGYHHEKFVVVPKAVEVAVAAPYYFSVSDGYRDSILADAVAFRVLQSLQGKAAASAPLPRYKEPARESPPTAPPMGRADAPGPSSGAALAKVLESRCQKCHNAPGRNGIDLSDPDKVPKGARWHSYALANSGEMPKGGQAIPDDEVKLLYAWAQAAR